MRPFLCMDAVSAIYCAQGQEKFRIMFSRRDAEARRRGWVMKKIILAVVLGIALTGFGETVTNVRGVQHGCLNIVDIYYDLNASDGGLYTVKVEIEGKAGEVNASTFTGDVGDRIVPGKNKRVVWDAGADWQEKDGEVKVVVTATKVVTSTNGKHEGVQLWEGGPYWATTNIGASNPEDYGLYFWWGDTVGHRPSSDRKFDFDFGYHNPAIYTYNHGFDALRSEGWIVLKDGAYVLTPSHDAAHVHWGGGWRIPNYQELYDLCYTYCDWVRTTMNGVNGWFVSGKGAYSSNSIFLPATGSGLDSTLSFDGSNAFYWSSHYSNFFVGGLDFTPSSHTMHSSQNNYGHSIRPVQDSSDATTADAVIGRSDWFFVDTTTDDTLSVSDVTSKYFDGEYSGEVGGRKSTFMNGVSCEIEMTVLCDYSKVDHWLVNGQVVASSTFSFDVGTIDVGGKLEVVAVGKEDGTKSKPFRANFDIAEHVDPDRETRALWTAHSSNSEGMDEIVYTPLFGTAITLPLALEKKGNAPKYLSLRPNDEWSFCPKIKAQPEMRSGGNGSLTFLVIDFESEVGGSIGKGSHKKRQRGIGKLARVMDYDVGIIFEGGPLTESWDPQKRKWVSQDVSFGIRHVGGSIELTHHYPTTIGIPVFIGVEAEFGLALMGKVSGLNAGWGGLDCSFNISSDELPRVNFKAGAGVNGMLDTHGEFSVMSIMNAELNEGTWSECRWGLGFSGSLKYNVFTLQGTIFELTSDTYWIINDTSEVGNGGGSGRGLVPKSRRLMSGASASGIEWRLQPRDYLNKAKPRMRLLAAAADSGIVESGGYPDPTPAMASGIAGDALAYLRDDGTRASADRTELVVRIGASNEWSAAESVWNDGTADFMPDVAAMSDGSFAAAWMNASSTFSDDVTIGEYCTAMEIAVGVRDAVTGEWTCRNLTADAAFDFAPVVRAAANGNVLVAWLRNASGNMVSSAVEPTDIMAAVYSDGQWSAPTTVMGGIGIVNGFDVAYDGENAVLAVSKDADGDSATVDDSEIYAVRLDGQSWGAPIRLTCEGDSDSRPFVRGDGDDGFSVLWTANGTLMETRELALSNAVAVAEANGQTFGVELTMIHGADGRDALVWNGNSTAGGAADAPTAMMYDPICGAWGSPVNLLDDGRRERRLAGAVGVDGGIRIGYESSSVATNAEGEVSFGDVELRTRYIPATCDLAVLEDGFSFSTNEFVNGETIALTVKAANLGFRTATNATVRVYEGVAEDKIELANIITNFPSGGVVAVNVPWTVDTTQTNLQFTVEVEACEGGEDDTAKSNNVYVWSAGVPDVAFGGVMVRNESATRRLVTARVGNSGLGPLLAGGKVVFRRGGENGEIMAEDTLGTVWPGADGVYDAGFAWDMTGESFMSAWETVCVQLFPDGAAGEMADMAFVQVMTTHGMDDASNLIPEVAGDADKTTVDEAVDGVGFVDAAVKAAIGGSAAEYNAFKEWAGSVKGATGDAQAGEAAVVASPHAAAAFLLGAERLFVNEPTVEIGEVSVGDGESVGTTAIAIAVTVKDGESAVAVNVAKIKAMFEATGDLGDWNGAAKLTPEVMVEEGDGATMRFKVTPGDGTAPRAFLRIRK